MIPTFGGKVLCPTKIDQIMAILKKAAEMKESAVNLNDIADNICSLSIKQAKFDMNCIYSPDTKCMSVEIFDKETEESKDYFQDKDIVLYNSE